MKPERLIAPKNDYHNVVVQELKDELLVYKLDTHRAYALNQTAAVVWQNCDGIKAVADIAADIKQATGREVSEDMVVWTLEKLGDEGLLDLSDWPGRSENRMQRREMLKRAGAATMIALPVITSLMAPRPTHAQSTIPIECATCLTKQHEADLCPTVCDATVLGDCHDNSGCGQGQIITQETCQECYARFVPGPSAATFSWHGRQYKP